MENKSHANAQLKRMLSYGSRIKREDMIDFSPSQSPLDRMKRYYDGSVKLRKEGSQA